MNYFACHFTEYLTEGRVYSASQFEDAVHSGGKAMGWELEVAGHISSVRTQRRWISVASSLAVFTSVQDPSPRNGVAQS